MVGARVSANEGRASGRGGEKGERRIATIVVGAANKYVGKSQKDIKRSDRGQSIDKDGGRRDQHATLREVQKGRLITQRESQRSMRSKKKEETKSLRREGHPSGGVIAICKQAQFRSSGY